VTRVSSDSDGALGLAKELKPDANDSSKIELAASLIGFVIAEESYSPKESDYFKERLATSTRAS
jgi:hypothetical protein